ncbi:MAG: tRNA uridine(34) 5-carboxymethylaminomethyl modification radical SAM/GNAT enzyme Elp3, partial [Spirochaetes bacterium]
MLEQEDFGTINKKKFYKKIIELILCGKIKNKDSLHKAKVRFSSKYGFKKIPRDSEILENLPEDISKEERERILSIIRKKPMRTISGVAIIAAMTSPASCPHGKCLPCPGGPENNTPQSYTGYEPAAMRAINNNFDPFLQTRDRLLQLKNVGHPVDKIDFIVMGGT